MKSREALVAWLPATIVIALLILLLVGFLVS